jgi:hypothetical protein
MVEWDTVTPRSAIIGSVSTIANAFERQRNIA